MWIYQNLWRKNKLEKEDIHINQAIIHILDSSVLVPVLSDTELELDSEVRDFIKGHIFKILSSDDFKECFFQEEDSVVYTQIRNYTKDNFVAASKVMAENLFEIMKSNVEIPSADLLISVFELFNKQYMALLKMNYKSSYIHYVESVESETINSIIKQRAALPTDSQKLDEAVIIDLNDYSIKILEKKYPINGQKENYLSLHYLQCSGNLSAKTKLNIINKTVEQINKKYFNDDVEQKIEVKKAIIEEYEETGSIVVNTLADKIFEKQPEVKQEFKEKIEKYGFEDEPVSCQTKTATKKLEKQIIKTQTGIEVNIPVEQYGNKEAIEFITNADGTISLIIKNIYGIN